MKTLRYIIASALCTLISQSIFASPPKSVPAADFLEALLRFEPWSESVWHDAPQIPGAGYFGDGGSEGNGAIRGNSGIALAYAVLVREFPDAPQRAHRLQRAAAALRYCALTHSTGPPDATCTDGKKWQHNWITGIRVG